MMKNNELSQFLRILFHFQSAIWKGMHFDAETLLMKLRKIAQRSSFNMLISNSGEKNVLHYITSRNMRRVITPSYLNEKASNLPDKMSPFNIKEILNSISYNKQQSRNLFSVSNCMNILKFEISSGLLGNLISKQPEAPVEDEESWGGPEQFKLIVFLKDDFDSVVKKTPQMLVFFYAYWCPHCLRLKKPYATAALRAKEAKLNMVFGALDVTLNTDIADANGVVGIPLIKYFKNGNSVSNYSGKRTADDLFEFVKNPPEPPAPSKLKSPDV